MSKKLIITISIIFKLLSFSFEICHQYCKYCNGEYYNDKNIQCTSCITGRYLIYNTTNCVLATDYPNYYINRTNEVLYPCSSFIGENCYECNPYFPTYRGKCISCNPGYVNYDGFCIYKDRRLSINWLVNYYPNYIRYPSVNVDKSGFLLIELTSYEEGSLNYSKSTIRKFHLYDKDGRGMFDKLND